MNLIKTDGRNFTATCLGCGTRMDAGDDCDTFADLHGKPFEAYYCGMCARIADPEHALTRVTDYLAREVSWELYHSDGREVNRQLVYDMTDAAVIIMARRADMALERIRGAQ